MSDDLRLTAIHEAGHAVAFVRLGVDLPLYGEALTIEPGEEYLGAHFTAGFGSPRHDNEAAAIWCCAGYAAAVAAGYPEAEALDGCGRDFESADDWTFTSRGVVMEKAVELMQRPENQRAVELVAAELLRRGTLDHQRVEALVRQADEKAS